MKHARSISSISLQGLPNQPTVWKSRDASNLKRNFKHLRWMDNFKSCWSHQETSRNMTVLACFSIWIPMISYDQVCLFSDAPKTRHGSAWALLPQELPAWEKTAYDYFERLDEIPTLEAQLSADCFGVLRSSSLGKTFHFEVRRVPMKPKIMKFQADQSAFLYLTHTGLASRSSSAAGHFCF